MTRMRLWLAYLRRSPLLAFVCALHVDSGRTVLVGAVDVAAHHAGDLRRPLRLAEPPRIGRSSSRPGSNSNYGTYFWNSTIVVVTAVAVVTIVGAMAAHCLARYRFRGNRLDALRHPVRHDLAAADADPLAVPDPLDYRLYNTLTGLISSTSPASWHDGLYSRGLLRADPARPLRCGAAWTAIRISRSSGASPCRSACRPFSPRSILNFIISLERVPLRGRAHDRR